MSVTARLEVRKERGVWADLRVVNDDPTPVRIHNPGSYRPTGQWEFSREAYIVAVLLSFHFLDMTLFTAGGTPVDRNPIATLADHLVELPIQLEPGADVRIVSIPLHEFYDLKPASGYSLEVIYGDSNLKVQATTRFQYP